MNAGITIYVSLGNLFIYCDFLKNSQRARKTWYQRVGRTAGVTADTLDVDVLREVVFLIDGVFTELALDRTGGAGLREHQKDPLRVDFREAIDFL